MIYTPEPICCTYFSAYTSRSVDDHPDGRKEGRRRRRGGNSLAWAQHTQKNRTRLLLPPPPPPSDPEIMQRLWQQQQKDEGEEGKGPFPKVELLLFLLVLPYRSQIRGGTEGRRSVGRSGAIKQTQKRTKERTVGGGSELLTPRKEGKKRRNTF